MMLLSAADALLLRDRKLSPAPGSPFKSDWADAETEGVSSEPVIWADELPYAFLAEDGSVTINYGLVTGREATQAEIDRLARLLRTEADAGSDLTITATRRQDYGVGIQTITHQVHVIAEKFPANIEHHCRLWLLDCADDRRVTPLDQIPN